MKSKTCMYIVVCKHRDIRFYGGYLYVMAVIRSVSIIIIFLELEEKKIIKFLENILCV